MFQVLAHVRSDGPASNRLGRNSMLGEPSPSKPLTGPETRLATRWALMVGQRPPEFNPFQTFGNLVDFIPSRLGLSPSLDHAAEYFLASYTAFRKQTPDDINRARISGAQALKSLRHEMDDSVQKAGHGNMLWTMLLHYGAEVRVVSQCY